MKRFVSVILFLAVLTLPARALLYSVTDLGTLGGTNSAASNVNDSGQVVGSADTGTSTNPFFWSSGTGMVDLGSLGGTLGWAENIDSFGNVVGVSFIAGNTNHHAFTYTSPGPLVDQNGSMGGWGANSIIYTRTDTGKMVGWNGGLQQSVYYDGSAWSNIGAGAGNSLARGVNDSGLVTGGYEVGGGISHAYSWTSGGGLVDLGTLGGNYAQGNYVNNSGTIVGVSLDGSGLWRAFQSSASGPLTDIGTLGGNQAWAWKINSSGDIVGWANDGSNTQQAFLYSGGIMIDLNTVLDGSGAGWYLQTAIGISDNGYIVGNGFIGGVQHAFLLTPVPEPASIISLLGGIGLLGFVLHRRRKT